VGDGIVVDSVISVWTGSVGSGNFKIRLEDLDSVDVLWVNAGLSALIILDCIVFDSRKRARGAAFLLEIAFNIVDEKAQRDCNEGGEKDDNFIHFLASFKLL
jgi:hypothetical protein